MKQKERGFTSFFDKLNSYNLKTLILNSNEFQGEFSEFVLQHNPIDAFFTTTSKAYEAVKALNIIGEKGKIVGYNLLEKNVECLKQGK